MNVQTCKFCGMMFQYPGFGEVLCPVCKQKETDEIKKIKEFLEENKDANAKKISTELEIPLKKIFYYIEKGIIVARGAESSKRCPRCGKSIKLNDRYCAMCTNELIRGFNGFSTIEEEAKSPKSSDTTSPKMRFFRKGN